MNGVCGDEGSGTTPDCADDQLEVVLSRGLQCVSLDEVTAFVRHLKGPLVAEYGDRQGVGIELRVRSEISRDVLEQLASERAKTGGKDDGAQVRAATSKRDDRIAAVAGRSPAPPRRPDRRAAHADAEDG